MNRFFAFASLLVAGAVAQADTLHLKDGRVLEGTFLSGTSRQVRFMVEGGRAQTFSLSRVESVRFGDDASSTQTSSVRSNTGTSSNTGVNSGSGTYRSSSQQVGSSGSQQVGSSGMGSTTTSSRSRARYTVPSGTVVTVRTIDAINSDTTDAGQTFAASLEQPLVVNGTTIAPRGADVALRVVRVDQASGISGSEEVSLELASIRVNGRAYNVRSSHAEVAAQNRNKETVKVVGGTAVLGAIIGAIAGGGKGAAIGAASGAGAGAAIQAIRGQRVQIPAESLLDFNISEPLYID